MPSFCQVMVGVGEPVALQGRLTGLFRITSREGGWGSITGSSKERVRVRSNKRICHTAFVVCHQPLFYLVFTNPFFFFCLKYKILNFTCVCTGTMLNPCRSVTETIFLARCAQSCLQTAVFWSTVSWDGLTLHCELHVAVGGACSVLSCAWVASRMTEFSWGDFYWTCVNIIKHKSNLITFSNEDKYFLKSTWYNRKWSIQILPLYNLHSIKYSS